MSIANELSSHYNRIERLNVVFGMAIGVLIALIVVQIL